MEIWSKSCRLACHRMDPRYSDHASEISSFPFHLFIRRPFLFYFLAGVFSVSVPRPFPKLRGRLSSVFIRRSEGRLLERIKPIHTLNLSTASHPATWCTSRIKRCYVNMEKVVDSCMRRTWISLSCPTSRETDAFVSLAPPLSLSRAYCAMVRVRYVLVYLFPTQVIRVERIVNFHSSNDTNVRHCH